MLELAKMKLEVETARCLPGRRDPGRVSWQLAVNLKLDLSPVSQPALAGPGRRSGPDNHADSD